MTTLQEREQVATSGTIRISLAAIVFAIILTIAGTLRFGLLGALPLDAAEAAYALQAWHFWEPPQNPPNALVSPAYFSFTTLLFVFLNASDAIARLAPSVFGFMAVALPWLWRARLGNAGALAVSALLAVSPVMNMLSTTASGDAMAVFAALLLFIAAMRVQANGQKPWILTWAVALGFGLTTSPLFYSLAVPLLAAWGLNRLFSSPEDSKPSVIAPLMTPGGRLALGAAAFTFVVASTLVLVHPQGLGDAAAQLAAWFGQFNLTAGLQALALPILALARYELLVVTLGAVAILWASWRGHEMPLLLVYWFAASLLLLLLQQGTVVNVAALVLPSYLLLGLWLQHALAQPAGTARWALIGALLLLGVIAYFNGARYLRVMMAAPNQLGFLLLAFIALASIFVAINFVRSWDRGAAYQGSLVGFILLFLIYNWGTARWMLAEGGADPREYWVETSSDDDLQLLVQTLQDLSWQTTTSPHEMEVLVALDAPELRWYLRNFPNASFGQTVAPGATAQAIITPSGDNVLSPGDDYLGGDFVLRNTGLERGADVRMTLTDTLRWWLFHEHPGTVAQENIILWARSDVLE